MTNICVYRAPYDLGCREETSQAVDSSGGPANIVAAYQELMGGFNIPQAFQDCGVIECDAPKSTQEVLQSIEHAIGAALERSELPVLLAGAHLGSLGALRALAKSTPNFQLVYFDAHPDVMPRTEIDYGSFLYHAVQEGLVSPERIAYIGIRQIEEEEREFINTNQIFHILPSDIDEHGLHHARERLINWSAGPVYLSIDLDCLDLFAAPGVSTPYPFGLSSRELLFLAKSVLDKQVCMLDIVELSPSKDLNERTARTAAILLHELSSSLQALH